MRMGPGPEAEPELDPGDCCSGSGSGSGIVPPWPPGWESELGRVFQPPSGLSCYHRDHQGPADLAQGLITDPGPQGLDLWADFHHSHTKWWDEQEPVQTERESEREHGAIKTSLSGSGWLAPPPPPPPPPSLHLALAHPRTHIVSHLSCPYKARPHPRRDVVSSKEEDPWGFWVLPSSPVGPQGWEFLLRSSPLHPSPPPLSSSLWGKEKRHFAWFAVRTRLFSPSFSRPLRILFLFSRFLLRPFFLSLMIKNKKKTLLKNLKKFLPWKVELNLQIRRKVQQNFKLLVFLRPRRLVLDLDVRVKKMSPVQKPRSVL